MPTTAPINTSITAIKSHWNPKDAEKIKKAISAIPIKP